MGGYFLAHSLDYARRLLKRLDLPADAELMLERPTYWDPTVCRAYFELCDRKMFDSPREGLRMARIAPELALLVPEEDGRIRHRSMLILGYAVLGSAHRAAGNFTEAENQYRTAFRLAKTEGIQGSCLANISGRLSVLRTCQKRFGDALKAAERAVNIYRGINDPQRLAVALISASYAAGRSGRYGEAADHCGEVLDLTPNPNASPEAKQLYHAACHNLADCALNGSPADLEKARQYVRRARRGCPKGKSAPKAKLRWIEGRIMIRFGSTRRGEAYLRRAIADLESLGAAYDSALVALELSALWRMEGRWRSLKGLAAETFRCFQTLAGDSEALAALSLWLDAVNAQALTVGMIRETQAVIEARMAPGNCCSTKRARGPA